MKDYPAQFGRSPLYDNPEVTLPMPSPVEIPRPQWYADKQRFRWTATPFPFGGGPIPPGIEYRAQWTSPAFDLRADLRSAQAAAKDGVPIWSTASRLYFQVATANPGNGSQPLISTLGLSVTATDFVNTTFNFSSDRALADGVTGGAGLLRLSTRNVSAEFMAIAPATSILAGFAPPGTTLGAGEGYPVRYWRLRLEFIVYFVSDPPLPLPDPIPPAPPIPFDRAPAVYWAAVY